MTVNVCVRAPTSGFIKRKTMFSFENLICWLNFLVRWQHRGFRFLSISFLKESLFLQYVTGILDARVFGSETSFLFTINTINYLKSSITGSTLLLGFNLDLSPEVQRSKRGEELTDLFLCLGIMFEMVLVNWVLAKTSSEKLFKSSRQTTKKYCNSLKETTFKI